jgi:5-methyltetrahydrofolate--homocysteine methyltransferase
VRSTRASDLLLGHDEWGASWIAAHRARLAAAALDAAAVDVAAEAAGA